MNNYILDLRVGGGVESISEVLVEFLKRVM
jgi:hypothetical protein